MHDQLTLTKAGAREEMGAMRRSLLAGFFMLTGKVAAYLLTGSSAIFSDAAESVIHVIAVGFAAYSLWLAFRPPDAEFPYGYERISFFSAGVEGALIILAAISILWTAVQKLVFGFELANLGIGTLLIAIAGGINGLLGWYLIRVGKKKHSIILEANGKHVLTDCITSAGVIVGLILVLLTGWQILDPLFAIGVALHILWSGFGLVNQSLGGLMDRADPQMRNKMLLLLDDACSEYAVKHHGLRFRDQGRSIHVEFHLLFPYRMVVGEAHRIATAIEEHLSHGFDIPLDITTHLESLEDHEQVHEDSGHFGHRGMEKTDHGIEKQA
jgi:cation diffusion facilitator family transporter